MQLRTWRNYTYEHGELSVCQRAEDNQHCGLTVVSA